MAAASLALAACGGGDSTVQAPAATQPLPTQPVTPADPNRPPMVFDGLTALQRAGAARAVKKSSISLVGLAEEEDNYAAYKTTLEHDLTKIVVFKPADYTFSLYNTSTFSYSPSGANFVSPVIAEDDGTLQIDSLTSKDWITMEDIDLGFGSGYDSKILTGKIKAKKGGERDNTLHAEVWHNYGESSTDYHTGGVWLIVPDSPIDAYYFGAFANGENTYPTDASGEGNVDNAVVGQAIYKGNAAGLVSSSEDGMVSIQRLLGKATLTADFGNATARGTIKGTIDDLTLDGDSVDGQLLIPEDDSMSSKLLRGIRSGKTDVTTQFVGNIDGIAYMGSWLGSFTGDRADNAQPTGIVGVIGGNGQNGSSFVASFGAKKVEDE